MIQSFNYLTKKYTSISWEKNSYVRILKMKPKEQYLNTVPKSYSLVSTVNSIMKIAWVPNRLIQSKLKDY